MTVTTTKAQEAGLRLADIATTIDGVAIYIDEPGFGELPWGYEKLFKALLNAKPVLDALDPPLVPGGDKETILEMFEAYRERVLETII